MERNTAKMAIKTEIDTRTAATTTTKRRSGQARLVYVKNINRNIPNTWRWARGDPSKIVLARPEERETWSYHCSLRLFAMIFVWFDCLLDLGTDFLFGNMVFVGNAYYFAVVHHFHGLFSFLQLCCEGPRFTSLQEDGCDKGAHQSYLGAERNTRVIPNWFQPCQCCCCLCYPGQCLRLGSLISRPQRDWQTEASLFFILFLSRLSKVFLFCFF